MLLDFNAFITDKTIHFTGREWVFKAINDWLLNGKSRIFLLAGDPGTGKSSISARLVQMSSGIINNKDFSELKPDYLNYYHFCQTGLDSTLSPLTFVQCLSEALANRYPDFLIALERAGSQQINLNITQVAGTVQSGGTLTGAKIHIEIKSGDARPMFDLAVRRPIQELFRKIPDERILILIDSLDEALTFNAENNIVQLLKLINDFPPQVHFICTCRSKNENVIDIVGEPALDMITNISSGFDEVKLYALTRLQSVAEPKCNDIADLIARKSRGNFLYAYHIINDLLLKGNDVIDPDKLDLPDDLKDVYRKFIEREMASSITKWNKIYRPLLGIIAVARGNGLTRRQLIGITKLAEDDADEVLKVCAQYLAGGDSIDSPYHIYHQSFRDFLLDDNKYSVFPAARHAVIAHYLQEQYGSNWGFCNDEYALRYTPIHLAHAAVMSEAERESHTKALIELTQNPKYQLSFERLIGNIAMLKEHLHGSVNVAALCERVNMLPWLIKATLGYDTFHRNYLQAESVVKLANEGLAEQAEIRLGLFTGIDKDWHTAARLIIVWLSIDQNLTAAKQLYERVAGEAAATEPLPLLKDRVNAALVYETIFDKVIAHMTFPLELAKELVNRIKGKDYDQELLLRVNPSLITIGKTGPQTEMTVGSGYAASLDAPALVNIAMENEQEGTPLVDEYIDAHAEYNYLVYRNRSLWFVLQAVLQYHPEQAWVKERLNRILVAVLSGGGVDFREMLPLTVILLLERATKSGVYPAIDRWLSDALREADKLKNTPGADDSWGNHKRRLTGFMELYALLLHDSNATNSLLDSINNLPGGFAGFQAPAYLRLADALRSCNLNNPGLHEGIIEKALRSAHHIQDYHFCARLTARCNALKGWHLIALTGKELTILIHRFAISPSDSEFAAEHFVHDMYRYREGNITDILPVTEARQAETLEQLADVFLVSAAEFRRLNPQFSLNETLNDKTLIRIPDPDFAPLLAIHLAARVMADHSLDYVRDVLLRELIPVAANNSTALDTVLSYLLIADQPDDPILLNEIAQETGPVVFTDVAPSNGQIGPNGVIPD